jgi:hypothetical protein
MIDPVGVEGACPTDNAMDFVPLRKKEFGKVRTVLSGDTGDKSLSHENLLRQ